MTTDASQSRYVELGELTTSGLCMFDSVLPPTQVEALRDVVLEQVDRSAAKKTAIVVNLLGCANGVFLELVQHPTVMAAARLLLGRGFLLLGVNAVVQLPGASAQALHNDQWYVAPPWPYASTMNAIWMLTPFTEANGGTVVHPGTHTFSPIATHRDDPDGWMTWDVPADTPFPPPKSIVGRPGSVAIWDGRLWHRAGANTTETDVRVGVQTYYCRPWIRQLNNYFLSLPPEVNQQVLDNPQLRTLFGYEPYANIGLIDTSVDLVDFADSSYRKRGA